jgi:hypothetical protein
MLRFAPRGTVLFVLLALAGAGLDQPALARQASDTGPLEGVAATSASNAWAVGSGAILHWNGHRWSRQTNPCRTCDFDAVAAVSARDAWAVGFSGDATTPILHWNGSRWVRSPFQCIDGCALESVAVVSANDVWAVGLQDEDKTLIVRWNGRVWRKVASPSPGADCLLFSVAATSASNAWAVGTTSKDDRTFILHWNGSTWTRSPSPQLPGSGPGRELASVSALSSRDAWAVGTASVGSGPLRARTLILHWNGTSWKVVPSANRREGGSYLVGVTGVSASDVWAVGFNVTRSAPPEPSILLIEHWNGRSWSISRTPLPSQSTLASVAATSASQAWAVGSAPTNNSLILRWNGTAWK